MNDHIRHGEGVVGIDRNDPDVPADRSGRHNDVFAGIPFVLPCESVEGMNPGLKAFTVICLGSFLES